jgi:glutathione synthase/RimK-type ligase-like ATP-grasp enzyme
MKSQIKSHPIIRRLTRHPAVWRLLVEARSWHARIFRTVEDRPIWDDRHLVEITTPIILDWSGKPKPRVGLVQDILGPPYWTRFERFLKANELPYEIYDIHRSDWVERAENFDVVIWRPISFPAELEEARRKIYLLEKELGKLCFPDYDTLLLYEDKIMQYERLRQHGLPAIDSFISHSYEEATAVADQLTYPLVSKIVTGSASIGVELVTTPRQAKRIIRAAFSYTGRWVGWPYVRQKDYVFFQAFAKNEGYDLRIMVSGNHLNGFYRDTPPGDFRASGMALLREGELPQEALRLAWETTQKLNQITLAVDMLRDPDDKSWRIIEIATFTTMHRIPYNKEGNPGSFVACDDGSFQFQPERYWLQETALEAFFQRKWLA